ncbi:MAG: phospholipase A, partial [Elusimicrobia bacterium]|nr:phospholipase A [Elusimicrobiota bacterium]
LSLQARNLLESAFAHGALQLGASVPIGGHFRAYAVFFNGFGQSLIEYNHSTTSFGLGIALNDWL